MKDQWTKALLFLMMAAVLALAARALFLKRSASPGASGSAVPDLLGSPALREFKLAERTERGAVIQLTLTNRDVVLKVEYIPEVDNEAAARLEQDGIIGLEALYADALSPYPGDISSRVVTDEKFRPQRFQHIFENVTNNYFLTYANGRLGYGALTRDEARFRSLLGWRYCARSRTFYKIRIFAPLQMEEARLLRLFQSLRCGR